MSITSSERIACAGCGAELEIEVVDSLNAERHPQLRQRVLDRQLHTARCTCGRLTAIERDFLYVDLARRQVLGVFPRADRYAPDASARRLAATFDRWFRGDAPAWLRTLAERCLVDCRAPREHGHARWRRGSGLVARPLTAVSR